MYTDDVLSIITAMVANWIVIFSHLNIPTAPIYGVYISQLIHYARACSLCSDLLKRTRIPSTKLLIQGFLKNRLISSFKTFFEGNQHLVEKHSVSCVQMTKDGIGNYILVHS